MKYHVCIDVRQMLRETDAKFRKLAKGASRTDGTPVTGEELRVLEAK